MFIGKVTPEQLIKRVSSDCNIPLKIIKFGSTSKRNVMFVLEVGEKVSMLVPDKGGLNFEINNEYEHITATNVIIKPMELTITVNLDTDAFALIDMLKTSIPFDYRRYLSNVIQSHQEKGLQ